MSIGTNTLAAWQEGRPWAEMYRLHQRRCRVCDGPSLIAYWIFIPIEHRHRFHIDPWLWQEDLCKRCYGWAERTIYWLLVMQHILRGVER